MSDSSEERRPALWDGRPFPGRCGYGDCPNQATSAFGRWTGGGPGLGNWEQRSRCDEHLGMDRCPTCGEMGKCPYMPGTPGCARPERLVQ
jgi:hypothetical protein